MKYKTLLTDKGNKRVRLTLTRQEATDLCMLAGEIQGLITGTVRETTNPLWDLLWDDFRVNDKRRLSGVTL